MKIDQAYEHQKTLDHAPWHEDGGEWTYLDCHAASDATTKVLIGVSSRKQTNSEIPVSWGEAVITTANASEGARFVEKFAKAFHQDVPASYGQKPSGSVKAHTAVLGANLARSSEGGFSEKSGTWTATKWFLEDDNGEAEVFFNYSVKDKLAEFSEKDDDYRETLVGQLVVGLRDGPRPERTPENDPTLTLAGPRVTGWSRFAGPKMACRFTPDSRNLLIAEHGTNSSTRIYSASVAQPDKQELQVQFEGSANVKEFLTNGPELSVLFVETLPESLSKISISALPRLWLVTDHEKQRIVVPASLTNWFMATHTLSPEGRFITLDASKTQSDGKRYRIIHLGDSVSGKWQVLELPGHNIELMGWKDGKGIVLTGDEYSDNEVRTAYWLNPTDGTMTVADHIPDGFEFGRLLSPDGRQVLQLERKKGLVLTELTSGKTREFLFHQYDRPNAYPGCVTWADSSYLVFQGTRTALINAESLRMNFPTAKESGFTEVEFSPDFKSAFAQKDDGLYLGHVEL